MVSLTWRWWAWRGAKALWKLAVRWRLPGWVTSLAIWMMRGASRTAAPSGSRWHATPRGGRL